MAETYKPILDGVLPVFSIGKVRETFEVPNHPDLLLVIATDRISTHNQLHKSLIPHKGIVLTALTVHWLRDVFADIPHHLVAAGREIYRYLPDLPSLIRDDLHLRAIIVKKLDMSPIELIYRRHLVEAGSLYKSYTADKDPYGIKLPVGLPVMHRFDTPLFTPTDKSATDDPLLAAPVQQNFSQEVAVTSKVLLRGEQHLADRGIIGLDTKFEAAGEVIADEIWTFDSSRFARAEDVERAIQEERDPPWLDKQIVRDEVERICGDDPKRSIILSDETIKKAADHCDKVLKIITGYYLPAWNMRDRFDFHI